MLPFLLRPGQIRYCTDKVRASPRAVQALLDLWVEIVCALYRQGFQEADYRLAGRCGHYRLSGSTSGSEGPVEGIQVSLPNEPHGAEFDVVRA
jgi:hypothetical protein